MTSEQLDALASHTSADVAVRELGLAERSRRLLALRLVLRLAREQPAARGPLAPVDEAWNVLIRAELVAEPRSRCALSNTSIVDSGAGALPLSRVEPA